MALWSCLPARALALGQAQTLPPKTVATLSARGGASSSYAVQTKHAKSLFDQPEPDQSIFHIEDCPAPTQSLGILGHKMVRNVVKHQVRDRFCSRTGDSQALSWMLGAPRM